MNRDVIVDQLGQVLEGEDISSVEASKQSDKSSYVHSSSVSLTSADETQDEDPFARLQKVQVKKALRKQQKEREEALRNRKMAQEDVDRVSLVSRLVIRYWILRTRMVRKLRVYVQSQIDMNIQSECLFCRSQYQLRVECMENLEDLFYDFLTETKARIGDFNY